MSQLTDRQKEVLEFIRQQQRETGLPPSSREIQAHFGFQSQTAAMNHLRALERKGVIERSRGKARAAVDPKLKWKPNFRPVSILGPIPAGLATDVSGEEEGMLAVDLAAFGAASQSTIFALRVRGDSMIGAQIANGDTAVLEKKSPKNGDIVAALIDGEVTLKRYLVRGKEPYLKAENPAYPDLIPLIELAIQGVMIGLIRKM
jgi:repressor LexA